ncbi:MAG TPA: hypothetical protein DCL76_04380 [Chloroflexi bacterium]|nr:hypothetical protein [Chloroflexota bacterium]
MSFMNMVDKDKLSRATEDYLKSIYELERENSPVSTNALALKMGFAPSSITGMLKKISTNSPTLINYEARKGVVLTNVGQKVALEIIRHHRLIELYLTKALGYSSDKVHEEADRLEHVISEEFEDKIALILGDPKIDPHGEPIPSKDDTIIDKDQ